MDVANRDLLGLIAAILLLIIRQSSINKTVQQFLQGDTEEGAFNYAAIKVFQHFIYIYELVAWVFPQPQNWFQQLLNSNTLDHWWKENFRVFRDTFEYICQLVGLALQRQNTGMQDAIPVQKCVGASLWQLATGDCYWSCGLMVGLAKLTVLKCCHEFVQEIC